jgi:hypothetical protein
MIAAGIAKRSGLDLRLALGRSNARNNSQVFRRKMEIT